MTGCRYRQLLWLVLTGLIVVGWASSAAAAVWHVSTDTGADTTTDGCTQPFKTIFAALDTCAAGDTILIYPGSYGESMVVSKDTIAILGSGRDNTFILPSAADHGCSAVARSGIIIRDLACTGNVGSSNSGMVFDRVINSRVERVRAYNRYHAVELNGCAGITVSDCIFDSSVSSQVLLDSGSMGNVFDSNLITRGKSFGVEVAYYLGPNSDSNTFTNNRVQDNNGEGFYIESVDSNYVAGNSVYNCQVGLTFNNGSGNIAYNNVFDSSQLQQIWCNGTNDRIDSNVVINGGSIGVEVMEFYSVVRNNYIVGNDSHGLVLNTVTENTITGNTIANNGGGGVYSFWGDSDVIDTNYIAGNALAGVCLERASNCRLRNNRITGNTKPGLVIFGSASSHSNIITQNDIASSTDTALHIFGTETSSVFFKNNITTATGKLVANNTTGGGILDLRRNWWGTTDSGSIAARLTGSAANLLNWQPYRQGECDTTVGADTIAPAAPDSVSVVSVSDTACTIVWRASANNEEIGGAPADLAGYRVYRSTSSGTTYWAPIGTTAAGDTDYCDSALTAGTTYYYRVTAYDNHAPWPNESWYSDSMAAGRPLPDTSGPNVWYVNDSAVAGDVFTTGTGNDANLGLSPAYPKRLPGALEALLSAGDTVYIDCGTYLEPDSIIISCSGVFIIGKDSTATVIDLGSQSFTQKRSICAVNVALLTLRDFRVTNGYNGLWFRNVDSSTITRVMADTQGNCGFLIDTAYGSGSDSNTLTANTAAWNSSDGFDLYSSRANDLSANNAEGNWIGFCLISSPGNRLTGNTIAQSTTNGVMLQSSGGGVLTANRCLGNGSDGIYLNGSDTCVLTANACADNGGSGICLQAASGNLLVANALTGNDVGVKIDYAGNNTLIANYAGSNVSGGFMLNDNGAGLGANGNRFHQNVADSNAGYGFSIGNNGTPVSTGDTFGKNIIITAPYAATIDSGVLNLTANQFDFTRNWWVRGGTGTTDSAVIAGMCAGSGAGLLGRAPYRLGQVDTTVGADTIAPAAPDSVTATVAGDTACTVVWRASASNEEVGGAPADLAGYRVYRSTASGTTYWAPIGTTAAGDTDYCDSGLTTGVRYYYRVTAYDNHAPWPNEGWLSDSIASAAPAPDTSGPNAWYVNATTGDTNFLGLSPAAPKKYLGQIFASRDRAVSLLSQGDTVYIAAGTYADTINIDTDRVWVIGVDSASTVISGGAAQATGIYADTQTFLTIRDLAVRGMGAGIIWRNVDMSMINGVTCSGAIGYGINLLAGCETNTIANNVTRNNGTGGTILNASSGNVLSGNQIVWNGGASDGGLDLFAGSSNNVIIGNEISANTYWNVYVTGGSDNNTLVGNRIALTTDPNGTGIEIQLSSGNILQQNLLSDNGNYQIDFNTAVSGCTIAKGNILPGAAYPDSGITNKTANAFVLSRNWWGTTDSAVIRGRIAGSGADSIVFAPFRLGLVDTAANADTIAPTAPDSVTVVDSSYATASCTINFTVSGSNEEIGGGAPGDLAGYRIYRSRTSDTSYWAQVGTTASATYVASGLVAGETYYFRVTAYDNHSPWANESWYSDSIVCVLITSGPGDFVSAGLSANKVDTADLNYLNGQVALYWGAAPADLRCDLSGNGILDFDDIAAFAVLFGP